MMLLPREKPYEIISGFTPELDKAFLIKIVPCMDGSGILELIPVTFKRNGGLYLLRSFPDNRETILIPEDQELILVTTASISTGEQKIVDFIYYKPREPVVSAEYQFSVN
ncbi:MAG: hypothetical protein IIC76_08470 [Bacteroidetes bacterium]|nr:hypothetical protein [Bacteroidota bacterium]